MNKSELMVYLSDIGLNDVMKTLARTVNKSRYWDVLERSCAQAVCELSEFSQTLFPSAEQCRAVYYALQEVCVTPTDTVADEDMRLNLDCAKAHMHAISLLIRAYARIELCHE